MMMRNDVKYYVMLKQKIILYKQKNKVLTMRDRREICEFRNDDIVVIIPNVTRCGLVITSS